MLSVPAVIQLPLQPFQIEAALLFGFPPGLPGLYAFGFERLPLQLKRLLGFCPGALR